MNKSFSKYLLHDDEEVLIFEKTAGNEMLLYTFDKKLNLLRYKNKEYIGMELSRGLWNKFIEDGFVRPYLGQTEQNEAYNILYHHGV